jgi:hypothetical protein
MDTPKREPVRIKEWREQHRAGHPHKILRDPEVEAFVEDALARMTFQAIADACLERFGPERAPRKSAVHRYWTDFHKARRPELHPLKRRRKLRTPSSQPQETICRKR